MHTKKEESLQECDNVEIASFYLMCNLMIKKTE